MKPRLFVRDLSEEERQSLSAGLRSWDAFVLRRSQILLASARGETAHRIAQVLSCDEQTVRHAIHAFNQQGLAALQAGSSRPHHLPTVLQAEVTLEMVKALVHRPPRDFGFETSLWTLDLLVQQCVRLGWMARPVSIEAMRQTLNRLGITGNGPSIGSPVPIRWTRKKNRA